jgi:hypothetical protein
MNISSKAIATTLLSVDKPRYGWFSKGLIVPLIVPPGSKMGPKVANPCKIKNNVTYSY